MKISCMKTHLLVTRKDYLLLLQMKMNIFLYLSHNIYFTLIYTILTIGILGITRRFLYLQLDIDIAINNFQRCNT